MNQQQIEEKHIKIEFDFEEFRPNIQIAKYQIYDQIGDGDQGKVYHGRNIQQNSNVAVKVIDKRRIEKQQNPNKKKKMRRLAEEESRNMMMINSEYVLKCYECYQSKDYKLMFIEYCDSGSLFDILVEREKFPEYQARAYLKQIINGISSCHQKKIIHRDIKLQNIFMHHGICKIADFGFSKLLNIEDEEQMLKNTILGNIDSMAPQVIFKQQYGLKADIWGLGVIFFQMITGRHPFAYKINLKDEITKYLTKKISQINKAQNIFGVEPSPEAKKFFEDVFVIDCKNRIGWKQLLQHEIFKIKQQNLMPTYIRPTNLNLQVNKIEANFKFFQKQKSKDKEENQCTRIEKYFDQKDQQQKVKKVSSRYMIQEQIAQSKKNIDRKQDIIYQWGQFIHAQCLRAEYIFENIIKPIEKYELLNLTQLKQLRLMFLLCNRCRNYISPINSEHKKRKDSQIFSELNTLVTQLYKNISEKWDYYDRKLGMKEALISKLKKQEIYHQSSQQFKFFNGFEDMREYRPQIWEKLRFLKKSERENNKVQQSLISYTKIEQIDFTQKFIGTIIQSLNETEITSQVKSYMMRFSEMCTKSFQNLEHLKPFLQKIRTNHSC